MTGASFLAWQLPPDLVNILGRVKEYLVVIEDFDVPLTGTILLGVFYSVPTSRTSATEGEDGEERVRSPAERRLQSTVPCAGIKVRNVPWPVRSHGPHRYHFQVMAE